MGPAMHVLIACLPCDSDAYEYLRTNEWSLTQLIQNPGFKYQSPGESKYKSKSQNTCWPHKIRVQRDREVKLETGIFLKLPNGFNIQ